MVDKTAMYSSESVDWNTPDAILSLVRDFAGPDGIGLDPCSNWTSRVGAKVGWSNCWGDDGLSRGWFGYGAVFVNYPYADAEPWSLHVVQQARLGAEIIVICPARTDTVAGQRLLASADAICFVEGRVRFAPAYPRPGKKSDSPAFPSMLLYYGPRADRFLSVFSKIGPVWLPAPTRRRPLVFTPSRRRRGRRTNGMWIPGRPMRGREDSPRSYDVKQSARVAEELAALIAAEMLTDDMLTDAALDAPATLQGRDLSLDTASGRGAGIYKTTEVALVQE